MHASHVFGDDDNSETKGSEVTSADCTRRADEICPCFEDSEVTANHKYDLT